MAQLAFELLGALLCYRPIEFADLLLREHLVESRQGLARPGEKDDSAHGSVDTVDDAHEDVAGLCVFLFDVLLHVVEQGAVSGLVGLDDFAGLLVDGDYVVVFVEDFHVGSLVLFVG